MKKKVLHLLASSKYSGAENVACTIIKSMSDEYEMYYCSPNGEIKNALNEKKITFIPLKKLTINEVAKVVKEISPHVIHAHDFKASLIAASFSKKATIVSHIHKNDPQMRKLSLKSLLYLLSAKNYKKIIGVSEAVLDEYIFSNKISNKYITIQNYVDKEEIIKKSNDFDCNKKYDLFFIGRLSEEKNPLEFINIVKDLEMSNINCAIIGDGPLRQSCEELISQYNLEKNIEMLGFQSNPYPFIKNSKIGIMPSKFEGFGITAIESLILGKPVLNSGAGGLKEIFKDNKKLICSTTEEYVIKAKEILKKDFKLLNDLSIYTDKKMYVDKLNQIYLNN